MWASELNMMIVAPIISRVRIFKSRMSEGCSLYMRVYWADEYLKVWDGGGWNVNLGEGGD